MFLVGLVDGTLPIQHADGDDEAIEEERRLLLRRRHPGPAAAVAVLGAVPHRRGAAHRRRSRFLYGLIPDDHPAARVPTGGRGGGAKPRCRVCGRRWSAPRR